MTDAGWQVGSTAPRDGRWILALLDFDDGYPQEPRVVRWRAHREFPWESSGDNAFGGEIVAWWAAVPDFPRGSRAS